MLALELSADLGRLTAVLTEHGPTCRILCATCCTPRLSSNASELFNVARSSHRVQLMLEALQAALANCARLLAEATDAFSEKMTAFGAVLRDVASETSPTDELLSLMATGVARCCDALPYGCLSFADSNAVRACAALQSTSSCPSR